MPLQQRPMSQMSDAIRTEVDNLKSALVTVSAEYISAQTRWDQARCRSAKESSLTAIDKWNRADRAIRAAIRRLEGLSVPVPKGWAVVDTSVEQPVEV